MSTSTITAAVIAARNSGSPKKPRNYPIGHSALLWLFFGWIVLWIPCIYFTISKKHKWHW